MGTTWGGPIARLGDEQLASVRVPVLENLISDDYGRTFYGTAAMTQWWQQPR
jgi:hypothetical protein